MLKIKEETRIEMYFFFSLLLLILIMLILNMFFGKSQNEAVVKKEQHKTVKIIEVKKNTAQPKAVAKNVREVIQQGNYSTAYMAINHVPKNSPEYEQLKKIISDENLKRKAPTIHKDTNKSTNMVIDYKDESTPTNRETDALYIYFVDIAGTFFPRFCIQNSGKRPLEITEFIITADGKNIKIEASGVKLENISKGISEWYEAPLDKITYEAVQAIINAKKVTLTIIGKNGKVSRDVTNKEKSGIHRVLDGYTALGGNFNYIYASNKPLITPYPKKQ